MPYEKKHLDVSDFPLSVEQLHIKTKQDFPIAIATNENIAKDIAARLNQDAWRQFEDQWSL